LLQKGSSRRCGEPGIAHYHSQFSVDKNAACSDAFSTSQVEWFVPEGLPAQAREISQ
jgi:hypothetical protein